MKTCFDIPEQVFFCIFLYSGVFQNPFQSLKKLISN